MLYENVFRSLKAQKIQYVVVGGVAMVLHGHVRFTFDLDLIVALSPKNLTRFAKVMTKMGYRPRVPVDPEDFADRALRESWRKEKHMKVFTYIHPNEPSFGQIDVFVYEPIPFKELYWDRVIVKEDGMEVSIVSLPHLLKLKKLAGREKDAGDIAALKKLMKAKQNR